MAKLTLTGLDELDESLPKTTILETRQVQGSYSQQLRAREELDTTNFGVPFGRSLMIQPVKCQTCGEEHYEHQGICLELHYQDGTRVWRKMELLEAAAYKHLPRNVQYAAMMAIDFCHSCYLVEQMVDMFFGPRLDVTGLDEETPCEPQILLTTDNSSSPSIEQPIAESSDLSTGKDQCPLPRPDPWSRYLPVPVPGETVTYAG